MDDLVDLIDTVVELAREAEVQPKHVIELLQPHDKILSDEKLLLTPEQKNMISWEGIYNWKSCCEGKTRDLEYHAKAIAGGAA